MSAPGERNEFGTEPEEGPLAGHAAEMRDLVPGQPETAEQPGGPSVGEFYMRLAGSDEVRNPTLQHLLARAAEGSLHQPRIWLGEDAPSSPNVHAIPHNTEVMARKTIGDAMGDASKWLDTYQRGVRTRDVVRGSRTLLDLQGENHFDEDMLVQFAQIVGMDIDAQVPVIPQSGEEHSQPDRFADRYYDTQIDGIQVRAWSHRRDGGSIWVDEIGGQLRPDNYTKYSLVPKPQAAERAA